MTRIDELIDIPTEVREGDFVLKLTSGVDATHAAATVDSYEVTDQLAGAFDQALGMITNAVESGESEATYLHGSFGSGKSHFMAVLHLLLQGDPRARAKEQLAGVINRHDPRLAGKQFLLVPVHFLDARSMEQKILGGYIERISELHPDATVPPVFLADNVVTAELPGQRELLGEDRFLAGLNGVGGGSDEWGEFGETWTTERVERALVASATDDERRALVAAYIAAYRQATATEASATGEGYIDLDRGLAAISSHARDLGYDAVVLFLDELILWLASTIGDLARVQRESQKLTNLVEGTASHRRPAPIISFVARQRDLRDLVGDHILGAERLSFADNLELQSGRFGEITLEARNLPVIAKRRLLRPVDDEAEQQLRAAVDQAIAGRDDVRSVLLGSEADIDLFRTVYPFSPTLVNALIDVAEALQRERTALKVMLQLLVDHRNELEVGDVIPVGDLWDVVAARDEPFSSDLAKQFERAKHLYRTRLRRLLLADHGLTDDQGTENQRWAGFRTDDRIIKTILLAALVQEVEAFRNLDAARLAALNWGTITTPIPGQETQLVVTKLRRWASSVGELNVSDDPVNPTVSLALIDVDPEEVIDRARNSFDNAGSRRRALRGLIDGELDGRLGNELSIRFSHRWRGTERDVDIVFGNIRDPAEVTDAALRAGGGRPRVVIDFPFDEAGRTASDDLDRLEGWSEANEATLTACWLPSFFNRDGLARLARFVAIDEVLRSDQRFEQHTQHLSRDQRVQLRPALTSMRDQLRDQLRNAVLAAYGVHANDHPWVDAANSLTDHFPSLDPAVDLRPPTQPTLAGALEGLCDQLLEHQYPGHPRFDAKVTGGMLRTAWDQLRRALAEPDDRIVVESNLRSTLRTVANPLGLGTMHESHFVLSWDWANIVDRHLAQANREERAATVGDMRAWIDDADGGPRGLPPEIADLVILVTAAQCDHSLTHGGISIEATPGRAMDPAVALRPERLPDTDTWAVAVRRAGALFGLAPGAHVSGPEVASLGDDVRTKIGEVADQASRLGSELEGAYRRYHIEDGDRLATARAASELVRDLRSADNLTVVDIIAGLDPPSSDEALARSLTTAQAVADALVDTNWKLLALAEDTVTQPLREVLVADEFAQPFDARRRDLEAEATRALGSPVLGPDPDGPEPVPEPSPEVTTETMVVSDEIQLSEVGERLRAAFKAGGSLRVWWQTPADPGSPDPPG